MFYMLLSSWRSLLSPEGALLLYPPLSLPLHLLFLSARGVLALSLPIDSVRLASAWGGLPPNDLPAEEPAWLVLDLEFILF